MTDAAEISSSWSDDRVEQLKTLWNDGLSASQIAKQLGGVTRNAVIGKVTRLGLAGRAAPSKPAGRFGEAKVRLGPAKSLKKARPKLKLCGNGAVVEAGEAPPPIVGIHQPAFQPLPGSQPRPWLERRFGECNWPVGGEGADTLSCCLPAEGGWCAGHQAIGHGVSAISAGELVRSLRRYA